MLDASRPPEPHTLPGDEDNRPEQGPRFASFWLCLAVGLIAIVAVVWLFGFTWWSALIAALLIGCPLAMAWILLGRYDR